MPWRKQKESATRARANAPQATSRVSCPMASLSVGAAVPRTSIKMRKLAEESEALIDLLSRERLHLFRTEALHSKGAHDTAIEHGLFKGLQGDFGLRGKIAEESAGERIARPRGVNYIFQRQRGCAEGQGNAFRSSVEGMRAKESGRAIFSMLDDQRLRPHGQDLARGDHQVAVVGEQLCF